MMNPGGVGPLRVDGRAEQSGWAIRPRRGQQVSLDINTIKEISFHIISTSGYGIIKGRDMILI